MSALGLVEFDAILDRMATLRVLVVGDLLLDEYRVGDVERVSPEAPVPIVRVRQETVELGGAGNVARGLVSLGAGCALVGVVGADREGEALRERVDAIGVSTSGLIPVPDRPTSHKLRVVARSQQMLRLDREEDGPISEQAMTALRAAVCDQIGESDVVVLEDYDKGLFSEDGGEGGLGRWIVDLARVRAVPVMADPKRDLARFRGASLVKPNLAEARAFAQGHRDDLEGRRSLLEALRQRLGGGEVVVTRGAAGMSAIDADGHAFDVPTRALEVYDVQGAGDTSMATLALCRGAGASLRQACIVANAAAAVAVEKIGTAAVERSELRLRLPEVLAAFEERT